MKTLLSIIAIAVILLFGIGVFNTVPARADFVRIDFEFYFTDQLVGMGYMQFAEVPFGDWTPISSLENLTSLFLMVINDFQFTFLML